MAVMTRITTNMIQRNYQNNLTSTLGGLESSRKQVETGRRFQYSYEDPTASAKAAILEKRYARVQDYIDNAENVQFWQNTQEDAARTVSDYAEKIIKTYNIAGVNGTNDLEARMSYATSIESLQEAMVSTLNAKYGDTFVLAGTEGKDPPFTLEYDEAAGYSKLFYRGVDVDTITADHEFLKEHSYVDLGFGLEIADVTDDTGAVTGQEVVSSSAFDAAIPGVNLVGYGTGDVTLDDGTVITGVSKNIVNLAGQLAKSLKDENFTLNSDHRAIWQQAEETANDLNDSVAAIGTKTQLLQSTLERLTNEKLNIETQFDAAVNINPAEAIMNYSWADYAYNSALKVGTSIISPSLLDFVQGR